VLVEGRGVLRGGRVGLEGGDALGITLAVLSVLLAWGWAGRPLLPSLLAGLALAIAIARKAGLETGEPITGEEITALEEDALADRLRRASVCAPSPGAEAPGRAGPPGPRRCGGHDGRRRERRSGPKAAQVGVAMGRGARTSRVKRRTSSWWTTAFPASSRRCAAGCSSPSSWAPISSCAERAGRARDQGARSNPLVGLLGGAVALVLLLLLLPPLRRLLDLGPLHFPALAGRLGTALVCGALLWASRRAQRVSALAT
jgi:hypothetical protein